MHVHVVSADGEAKFWLGPEIELAKNFQFSRKQLKEIEQLIETHMSLLTHGNNTSAVEITHISSHGLWLLAHNKELFMSYDDFPWFKDKTVKSIINVQEPSPGHYYWPDLDVDLTEEIICNPERFPMKAK